MSSGETPSCSRLAAILVNVQHKRQTLRIPVPAFGVVSNFHQLHPDRSAKMARQLVGHRERVCRVRIQIDAKGPRIHNVITHDFFHAAGKHDLWFIVPSLRQTPAGDGSLANSPGHVIADILVKGHHPTKSRQQQIEETQSSRQSHYHDRNSPGTCFGTVQAKGSSHHRRIRVALPQEPRLQLRWPPSRRAEWCRRAMRTTIPHCETIPILPLTTHLRDQERE
jgi:hypothetical protein